MDDLQARQMMRRQSSGGASAKRIVNGREETREERRARKERERTEKELSGESSRHSHMTSRPSNSPYPSDEISRLSLGSPPTNASARMGSSSAGPGPASSKSVLTIALQRAQSAVLLDSANNVPAAIAAYSQSVRLLKEVMARVDESARREKEKEAARGYDRTQPRPAETREDFERRIAKLERKERAKQDEARRLKVIHDTYEDRIRMLQAVQSPRIESEDPSVYSTPATIYAGSPDPTFEHAATSTALSRRDSRSIQSLGTVSTPPAIFAPAVSTNQISPIVQASDRFSPLNGPPVNRLEGGVQAGSPPPSPMDPMMSAGRTLNHSTNGHLMTLQRPEPRVAPSMVRRPSLANETIVEEQEAMVRDRDTTLRDNIGSKSGLPTALSPGSAPYIAVEPDSPRHESVDRASHSRLPRSSSLGSFNGGSDGEGASPKAHNVLPEASPDDDFVAGAIMQRTGSAPTTAAEVDVSPAMRRGMSGSSMYRTASSDSTASTQGTTLFGPGGFTQMAGQHSPLVSGAQYISSRYSVPAFGLGPPPSLSPEAASRPRPTRSASLANTPIVTFNTSHENGSGLGLISSSTSQGTISQRRRPSPSRESIEDLQQVNEPQDHDETEEATDTVNYILPARQQGHERAPSAEPTVPSQFGLAPQSSSGSYASASLPTRLRTTSQPITKRPGMPSYSSEDSISSTPPLHISTQSTGMPLVFPRKPPLPSGINTQSAVKRSDSFVSQHSTAERDSRLYSPSIGNDSPAFFTFTKGTLTSSSELLRTPPMQASETTPVSTVRRPFHLLRQIQETLEGEGAYLTPRLYLPRQVWSQAGVKLVAIETKVRMLDLLRGGLEVVNRSGEAWVRGHSTASTYARELESLDGLMEGIQSTLSKKLGYGPTGKKTGATSFSAWSSKLSRSLDRVTNGRSLDHPSTYIDALTRLIHQALIIDTHLIQLDAAQGPYAHISSLDRNKIETRLRRSSEFFAQVICRFVMRDIGILVDKYIKRAGTWFGEG